MQNLLSQAILNADLDAAIEPIMKAVGIPSGDVAAQVFSGSNDGQKWASADKATRSDMLGAWLKAEALYADPSDAAQIERAAHAALGDAQSALLDTFKNSRREVADLGAALSDESYKGYPGFLYLDALFIESVTDSWPAEARQFKYHLLIGRQEWLSNDLGELEAHLFEFAMIEGYLPSPSDVASSAGGA